MTRVGVISQARMTSTRLPGKILLTAAGRTFLDHHLDRLADSGLDLFVATTTNSTDDVVAELCAGREVPVHRGPEDDVLARYAGTIREFGLDVVVRVTSDCPLIDGALVRQGVDSFLEAGNPDLYLSNTLVRSFPRGFDFEVFSSQALLDADARATAPHHREHVTPFLYENVMGCVETKNLIWSSDKSSYRVTLDTEDDRMLLTTLFEQHHAAELSSSKIIEVLDANPELAVLNRHVEQKKLTD